MEACSERCGYRNTVRKAVAGAIRAGEVFGRFSPTCPPIKFSPRHMQWRITTRHLALRSPAFHILDHNPKTCPSPAHPALSQRGRWTISLKIPHLRCQNQSQSQCNCGDSPSLVSLPTWEQAELNVTWATMDRGDANVYSVTFEVIRRMDVATGKACSSSHKRAVRDVLLLDIRGT